MMLSSFDVNAPCLRSVTRNDFREDSSDDVDVSFGSCRFEGCKEFGVKS